MAGAHCRAVIDHVRLVARLLKLLRLYFKGLKKGSLVVYPVHAWMALLNMLSLMRRSFSSAVNDIVS